MPRAALLIIDVLNTFDFIGGDALLASARCIVAPIVALREQTRAEGVPVIYVNDNYGRWHDEKSDLIKWLDRGKGGEIARALAPRDDEYFVIKPEASGFYATTLPALLPRLGVDRLVLTGIAADICVQFTAADAHMREYPLWVPRDAVAGTSAERGRWAIELMADTMGAEVRQTGELKLCDAFAAAGGAR